MHFLREFLSRNATKDNPHKIANSTLVYKICQYLCLWDFQILNFVKTRPLTFSFIRKLKVAYSSRGRRTLFHSNIFEYQIKILKNQGISILKLLKFKFQRNQTQGRFIFRIFKNILIVHKSKKKVTSKMNKKQPINWN